MKIKQGTRLGPYEILAAIGAGGMGEVYKAKDTRLDRTVAIKVLPEHLAGDPDLRERFEREARTVSSLNHPHICTLHDIGRESDVDFLVMEHIEGETLAARLERGPLSLDEVVRYGTQISQGLDQAHRQGVVHRDVKPGNIMLTGSGAKLLDFGLAKPGVNRATTDLSALSSLPTEQRSLTEKGVVLGTFQYMAPEQLEGKDVDVRTDIFALGALLYEMVTGKKAFAGASQASLISAIMSSEPTSMAAVEPASPAALEHVIRTCLAKDPDKRWQSAGDVALELEWIAEVSSQAAETSTSAGARGRERAAWAIAGLTTIAAILLAGFLTVRPPTSSPMVRFDVPTPDGLPVVGSPKISPDGRYLAFNATDEQGASRIWLRALNALQAQPLPGSEGSGRPFWSPDSTQLGFFADGKLKRIPVAGGPAQTICNAASGADGSWSEDGVILYDGTANDPIMQVAASGGIPSPLVTPEDENNAQVGWPQFLPGSRNFLYVTFGANEPKVRIGSLDGGERTTVLAGQSRVEYAPPGHLLYVRENTLVAQGFDADAGEITGQPIPLAENLGINNVGLAHFSASRNGVLAFRGGDAGGGQLVWVDRQGEHEEVETEAGQIFATDLSPDGRWLAIEMNRSSSDPGDIWVRDLVRGVTSRFTFEEGSERTPIWSPTGERIAFSMEHEGRRVIAAKAIGGPGEAEILLKSENLVHPSSWSPDGRFLLYYDSHPENGWDIRVLSVDSEDRESRPFLDSAFTETRARFSPDGRWVVYESTESGRAEIYVQAFPGPGRKWQISTNGGSDSRWSPEGDELYYLDAGLNMMRVTVQPGEAFEAGIPEPMFSVSLRTITVHNRYLLSPDGERFLLLSSLGEQTTPPTTVVLNWNDEINK